MFVWNEYLNGTGTLKKWGLKSKVREEKAAEKIRNERLDYLGGSIDLQHIFRLKLQINKLYLKQFKKKDKSNQIEIDLKEAELNQIYRKLTEQKEDYFMENVAAISKMISGVDYKKITIFAYDNHLKTLEKWQKAAQSTVMK